ncbi:MAG: LytR/AlgR family response regulator transcription factor [Crocinitomicaceae bacterium]
MNVLIVEDEIIAFEKLKTLLMRILPDFKLVGHAQSIEEGIDLIETSTEIDLAFFDIQLQDGLSFSILEQVQSDFPIIFTTAYDDYAIRAFDHHSIAYLLKPIRKESLEKALDKFKTIQPREDYGEVLLKAIREAREVKFKERFTVKAGNKIRLVDVNDIACFYSRDKGTYIFSQSGKHFLIDQSMEQLEQLIDPKKFHRINRKQLIHISAIDKVIQYTNSRLRIDLQQPFDEDLIVARERVKTFKNWLEG